MSKRQFQFCRDRGGFGEFGSCRVPVASVDGGPSLGSEYAGLLILDDRVYPRILFFAKFQCRFQFPPQIQTSLGALHQIS